MDQKLHDQGLANRKEVLGAEYVERSLSQADDFNQELQEVLNEYCWGKIWSGNGLDRKQRSILNLG
ncbi:MAG TPA: 4-carboxymuconolactone decarboxylase, partial [Deltaproteobacteria bacterium]|nr:4-carboxymuconolactone decarboxylase [Deltaproteobacteria bacterium]